MATVRDWFSDRIGLSPAVQMHLLVTIIVIAGLWIIERLVLAVVYRRVTDPWSRYRWRKTITYLTLAIAVLVIGREWLEGFKSLATFLGLVSAGFGNRWNLPDRGVVARWRAAGTQMLNTADAGAITVRFPPAPGEIEVRAERLDSRRWWRRRAAH